MRIRGKRSKHRSHDSFRDLSRDSCRAAKKSSSSDLSPAQEPEQSRLTQSQRSSTGGVKCRSTGTSFRYDAVVPRPKQRTPQLRDHLVQVAVDLLENEGIAGFTTRRVASKADTSAPALYELFGDKAGLVREVFFEGFRLLHRHLEQLDATDDPRADLVEFTRIYRRFATENPVLAAVMFSRPFADFDPAPSEAEAGRLVREFVVGHVQRAIDVGLLAGDATDNAHVLLATTLGLAAAENASRLGRSRASVDRRWELGIEAVLRGLAPAAKSASVARRATKKAAAKRGGATNARRR
jgi:AcrR family transcriptional regulator